LLLGSGLETLPGKGTTAEVEHDIAQGLHVVTARLLNAEMGVDTGITGSASQVLVLTVGDVEVSLGVTVLLGQTKVNDVHLVSTLADAHEEVVGLDVSVDERLGVDVFDAGDQLVGQEQDGLEGELSVAEVEQVFQTGAEKVDDHGIVVTFGAEPAHEGDAHTAGQGLVDTGFIFELGVLGLDALQLNSDLFSGDDVGACKISFLWLKRDPARQNMRTQVDVTKTTASNLASNTVLVTDPQIHGRHLGCKAVRIICCRRKSRSATRGREKNKCKRTGGQKKKNRGLRVNRREEDETRAESGKRKKGLWCVCLRQG
jgi:hypothetical protein